MPGADGTTRRSVVTELDRLSVRCPRSPDDPTTSTHVSCSRCRSSIRSTGMAGSSRPSVRGRQTRARPGRPRCCPRKEQRQRRVLRLSAHRPARPTVHLGPTTGSSPSRRLHVDPSRPTPPPRRDRSGPNAPSKRGPSPPLYPMVFLEPLIVPMRRPDHNVTAWTARAAGNVDDGHRLLVGQDLPRPPPAVRLVRPRRFDAAPAPPRWPGFNRSHRTSQRDPRLMAKRGAAPSRRAAALVT